MKKILNKIFKKKAAPGESTEDKLRAIIKRAREVTTKGCDYRVIQRELDKANDV